MIGGTLHYLCFGRGGELTTKWTEYANAQIPRRIYCATPLGRTAIAAAKNKAREFFGELIGE